MSIKAVKSVLFNGLSWDLSCLGESCILLQTNEASPEVIHHSAALIQHVFEKELTDIVPAYRSISIFTESPLAYIAFKLSQAESLDFKKKEEGFCVEVPICYELGPDLEEVARQTSLLKETIIAKHLAGCYHVDLIGFTPGFLYLSGLPKELSCERRSEPRRTVEIGSVGIGGSQAGIYSLASPGGWNIIGRTPVALFDRRKTPPMEIAVGSTVLFKRISKAAFEAWEN